MQFLPEALAPLASYRQFIVYLLIPSKKRPGKTDKFPIDYRTGRMPQKGDGGAHDPAVWTDAQTAIDAAARLGDKYGVGFVFTEHDPFWFLDIDNCRIGDAWTTLSCSLVQALPGAAVEVSSSGKGLHIIGTGKAPAHGCKHEDLGLEFYTEGRFVALTGTGAQGSASTDCSHLLPSLVHQFFPPAVVSSEGWTEGPCEGWNGPADDDVLIQRALRSQSSRAAFGNTASFADLWECNVEALAKAYPDPDSPYNSSRADMALAQHLAFWTGKDCERIERLMMRSALVRPKWDREDYLRGLTIPKACGLQVEFLTDKQPQALDNVPATESDAPRGAEITGNTFLTIDQQVDLFQGCVYVCDAHRVLVPGGLALKPDQFRVMYGGYSMPMDRGNERTSRDSWEVFTQSQAFRSPRADSTCFKPGHAPGEIIHDAGRTRVNTWWPVDVPRKVGDAGPFLRHLEKILPNERDRRILLSYMAACVQHKGVKFQWAPLLQGAEGNGKTLFTRCVAEAVGHRYVHWPKASQLATPFNAWLLNKVFIAVEDIYVPDSKREVIEELKPMITGGTGLEIQAKGVDQMSTDICANFIFNTNHKNGIRKTRGDRRFCVFYTAQQTVDDIMNAGMGGDYFPHLYSWLRADGYAIVSELLHTMPIDPEFNPAGACMRAPITSSTEEAIEESLGSVEQEVQEAIEQGLPGFAGGWVSSMALDRLLDRLGASRRVPPNKRAELLQSLGYAVHPGLPSGRVNNTVLPDAGKPRLFVIHGHPLTALTVVADIARAYSLAQEPQAAKIY